MRKRNPSSDIFLAGMLGTGLLGAYTLAQQKQLPCSLQHLAHQILPSLPDCTTGSNGTNCPTGTVWNGTACVPIGGGNDCPAGTVWNGSACVPSSQLPPTQDRWRNFEAQNIKRYGQGDFWMPQGWIELDFSVEHRGPGNGVYIIGAQAYNYIWFIENVIWQYESQFTFEASNDWKSYAWHMKLDPQLISESRYGGTAHLRLYAKTLNNTTIDQKEIRDAIYI